MELQAPCLYCGSYRVYVVITGVCGCHRVFVAVTGGMYVAVTGCSWQHYAVYAVYFM